MFNNQIHFFEKMHDTESVLCGPQSIKYIVKIWCITQPHCKIHQNWSISVDASDLHVKCLFSGVKQGVWAEEASMVFRNHVEKKPLVAQIESVEEGEWPWERKISVYLVDTTLEDNDIWIHNIMVEFLDEINWAAWDCHNVPFQELCWNFELWRNLEFKSIDSRCVWWVILFMHGQELFVIILSAMEKGFLSLFLLLW